MNIKKPKEIEELSKGSLKRINDYYNSVLKENTEKYESEMQKIYLKFCCIALHEGFGFGKDRCMQFIGNWKRFHHLTLKLTGDEALKWIEDRLSFFDGEYPEEWINNIADGK